ncbi:chromate transporter [Alkalihalobacillus alcalophilus ATCC 27647 = CGMCC 1.3604]|uniref:Chromate ion transporter n=1 Tax=Alkalihalobacillus alcalophilus ATCC 27647 = CGMCC 1.3604 TaxID=1218173 RepID=J8QAG2_ALKAL|nr:chromate transporter [Alkalihalobacillus alcalophilus]AFV25762.1 chromate ion transporter [Alkalihalobacillus alcalophilus ATCC 27647 = CGMCC 1.3604]KGA96764.1 chromate transporter [Alkalihalobacillus alcalophilus ATCC 27647 = CGMCC 1.3604]MED1561793.1 chromate transporter [Alkalihalobacillus alcalophilus]THG91808.1 chromate transporter [Alkalihalobacillus alcalophilus ATCC 27647 = CGMCC 1.3604]
MDWRKQRNIFIAFFRSGMLGYGGGPSTIPLVHKEVVHTFKWLTDEEFGDVLALGNALPGPINTKMSGYIGYKVGGWVGLINAIIATIMPTVLLMIGLIGLLSQFRDSRIVAGMTEAVAPVVGVMLATLTYGFLKQSKGGIGWGWMIVLTLISLLLYQFVGVHPAIIIAVLLVYALLKRDKPKEEVPNQREGES